MPKTMVPVYTVIFSNGATMNFESGNIKITQEGGKLLSISAYKRDGGLSLIYADPSHIVGIVRDSSGASYADGDAAAETDLYELSEGEAE